MWCLRYHTVDMHQVAWRPMITAYSSSFIILSARLWSWFVMLQDKEVYCWPVQESLKTMLSWGWSMDRIREGAPASLHNKSRRMSQSSQVHPRRLLKVLYPDIMFCATWLNTFHLSQLSFEGDPAFSPRPVDMSNVTLSRDMQVNVE